MILTDGMTIVVMVIAFVDVGRRRGRRLAGGLVCGFLVEAGLVLPHQARDGDRPDEHAQACAQRDPSPPDPCAPPLAFETTHHKTPFTGEAKNSAGVEA